VTLTTGLAAGAALDAQWGAAAITGTAAPANTHRSYGSVPQQEKSGNREAGLLNPGSPLLLAEAASPFYCTLSSRRLSFERWDETKAPRLESLLSNGMHYVGPGDAVRCFYCNLGLRHWEADDDVWEQHARLRPKCKFLLALKGEEFVRNAARPKLLRWLQPADGAAALPPAPNQLANSAAKTAAPAVKDNASFQTAVEERGQADAAFGLQTGFGVAGSGSAAVEERGQAAFGLQTGFGVAGSGSAAAVTSTAPQNSRQKEEVTHEQLGIIKQKPKRLDLVVTAARVNTFTAGWPHERTHPKTLMAEAGFYFVGVEDLVRCFYCKGGLKTWETADDPWIEHCRWLPSCSFVKLCKGQLFVAAVTALSPNPKVYRPTITMENVANEIDSLKRKTREPCAVLFSHLAGLHRFDALEPSFRAGISEQEMAELLENENDELRCEMVCKVCCINEISVVFLPCGHLVTCYQCAPALTNCAMCRATVRGITRVLMEDDSAKFAENVNPF